MRRLTPRELKWILSKEGVRLELGQPFPIRGGDEFMCLAKFVVPRYRIRRIVSLPPSLDEVEATQTLCIVAEAAPTPQEARQRLLERLGEARRLPTVPPPAKPRRGWLGRLIKAFK